LFGRVAENSTLNVGDESIDFGHMLPKGELVIGAEVARFTDANLEAMHTKVNMNHTGTYLARNRKRA
jgi:hypothetical protein